MFGILQSGFNFIYFFLVISQNIAGVCAVPESRSRCLPVRGGITATEGGVAEAVPVGHLGVDAEIGHRLAAARAHAAVIVSATVRVRVLLHVNVSAGLSRFLWFLNDL
jgi:hypothetical protein